MKSVDNIRILSIRTKRKKQQAPPPRRAPKPENNAVTPSPKKACVLWAGEQALEKYHARSVTIIRERFVMAIKTLTVVTKAAR